LILSGNTRPYLDPLTIYDELRLGMTHTTPLFGDLRDSGHETGASFLLFLRDSSGLNLVSDGASADLAVTASKPGAEIFINGVSYGTAPILASKLPVGEVLKVSGRADSLSGSAEVTLKPKEVRQIALKLEPMKANLFVGSSATDCGIFIDGISHGTVSDGIIRDILAGPHIVELKGTDVYFRQAIDLPGDETVKVDAEPWPVGKIAYAVAAGQSATIKDEQGISTDVKGSGVLENIAAGFASITTTDPGYGAQSMQLAVSQGQTVSYRLDPPGSILITGIPAGIVQVIIDGQRQQISGLTEYRLEGLNPDIKHSVMLLSRFTTEEISLSRDAIVEPEKETVLSVATGTFSFPWLPDDADVTLNGEKVQINRGATIRSVPLGASSTYPLSVSIPSIGTLRQPIVIEAGKDTAVPEIITTALDLLSTERTNDMRKLLLWHSHRTNGWISFGVGLLGAVGVGASYVLGSEAMSTYNAATTTGEAVAARKNVNLYGTLVAASAAIGGVGFFLTPIFWTTAPDRKKVQASIDTLDREIEGIEEATKDVGKGD
jgi:hypothetical protein